MTTAGDRSSARAAAANPPSSDALLPPTTDFYRYNGSLTTPPCTEGVRWYVMSEVAEASEEQLRAFLSLTGRNNRPVQPVNNRPIRNAQ